MAIERAGRQAFNRQVCYSEAEVAQVERLSQLRVTAESRATGRLQLTVPLAANGANVLVIEPADTK